MLDQVAITIASGAAANVIAYMFNGRVEALRAQVSRMFRRSDEREQAVVLHKIDADVAALAEKTASDGVLTAHWAALFAALLVAQPEAREEVEAFASAPVPAKTVNIGSQHNHGSGVFIGGDNHGEIGIGMVDDAT